MQKNMGPGETNKVKVGECLGPKLKFICFPLPDWPWKKASTLKKLFQFQLRIIFIFKFHCKLRELSYVNSVIFK